MILNISAEEVVVKMVVRVGEKVFLRGREDGGCINRFYKGWTTNLK